MMNHGCLLLSIMVIVTLKVKACPRAARRADPWIIIRRR